MNRKKVFLVIIRTLKYSFNPKIESKLANSSFQLVLKKDFFF